MKIETYELSWWYKKEVLGIEPFAGGALQGIIDYNRGYYVKYGILPGTIKNEFKQLEFSNLICMEKYTVEDISHELDQHNHH